MSERIAETPFCREVGTGPSVVCLHSSASSSGQWRALMDRLKDRFRVIAVDLYGSGRTAPWPQHQPMYLDDEIALLRPVFQTAGDRFHLVGHSYGGAIALKAALAHQERLISLVVFEPVLFSILVADAPDGGAAQEVVALRDDTVRLIDQGALDTSAERFVDYWTGSGAWAALPKLRQAVIAGSMRSLKPEWHALLHESAPLAAFANIDVPTLLMTGTGSKAPTRAIVRLWRRPCHAYASRKLRGWDTWLR